MPKELRLAGYLLLRRVLGIRTVAIFLAVINYIYPWQTVAAADRHRGHFRLVMSRPQQMGLGSVQIDGGTKQDPVQWGATLKFLSAKRIVCTSTIVGDHVILTSAHCIGGATAFSVDLGEGRTFDLSCDINPKFERRTLSGDIALCHSEMSFPRTNGFEAVDLELSNSQGSRLFLLGYGCRSVVNFDQTGQLYGGSSKVFRPSTVGDDHLLTRGGVVICPGDSGGAAYRLAVDDQPVNPRSIVGVNSSYEVPTRTSAITTFAGSAGSFIREWAKMKGASICGLDPMAEACHDRYTP